MIGTPSGTWIDIMQVCENGHKITGYGKSHPEDLVERCPECGVKTLTQCPNCKTNIPGYKHHTHVASVDYSTPPDYCNKCGEPFPWTGKILKKGVESKEVSHIDTNSRKIFIVHGHDEDLKNQLERFLIDLKFEPIILHRQPDQGQTIIEKLEKNSDVRYAFILLTPDDIGYPAIEEKKMIAIDRKKEGRARQNVIFEFGYFTAKLGRNHVCCIYKKGVSLPTDVSGIIYKKINQNISEIVMPIMTDLASAGFKIDIPTI